MACQDFGEHRRTVQVVPTSDSELLEVSSAPQRFRFKRVAVVAFVAVCGVAASAMGFAWWKSAPVCSRIGAGWAQEKVELDAEGQMKALAKKFSAVKSKDVAQKIVEKAARAAREAAQPLEAAKGELAAPARRLPNSFVQPPEKGAQQGTAVCIFNVMEAMTAMVALGDDISAMTRVCPSPRDAASEIACQVDSGAMVAYVGVISAKLALAASNCGATANIDAICAAGVWGLVSALGELAATASLAAPTCSSTPPALPTTKISELGDQTLHKSSHSDKADDDDDDDTVDDDTDDSDADTDSGRRLIIGEGAVGNGVQCGVDVGFVAENFANLGLAINSAANSGMCKSENFDEKGLVESICAVDIGGAIAYFSQAVTFIQIAILNCKDFLDIKALCGASIAGIATAAAAIAPYGAAIHAGCSLNQEAKVATGTARRLGGHHDALGHLNEVTAGLRATLARFGRNASSIPSWREQNTASEADLKKLVSLMEPGLAQKASFRGADPVGQECQ